MKASWYKISSFQNIGITNLPAGNQWFSANIQLLAESVVLKAISKAQAFDNSGAGQNFLVDHWLILQDNNGRISFRKPNVLLMTGTDNTTPNIFESVNISGNQTPDIPHLTTVDLQLSIRQNVAVNFAAAGNVMYSDVWLYILDP